MDVDFYGEISMTGNRGSQTLSNISLSLLIIRKETVPGIEANRKIVIIPTDHVGQSVAVQIAEKGIVFCCRFGTVDTT